MYWTLDTRPPTLDERIVQAKARHAERVEQIAAEEPVPQLEVPHSQYGGVRLATQAECEPGSIGPTFTVRPGHYFEVSDEAMRDYFERQRRLGLQHLASFQNTSPFACQGRGSLGAAAQQAAVGLYNDGGRSLTNAVHTFQMTKDGTRLIHSRGPSYHPPTSFGTLTEFS